MPSELWGIVGEVLYQSPAGKSHSWIEKEGQMKLKQASVSCAIGGIPFADKNNQLISSLVNSLQFFISFSNMPLAKTNLFSQTLLYLLNKTS